MTKISAYIILYFDLDFIDLVINQIYHLVDEIVIIDGPYSYTYDIMKNFGLLYEENTKPEKLNEIIAKYDKIKYEYKVFEDEVEKRIYAYNKCSHDIIWLVDCDQIYTINEKNLTKFINNRHKYVGAFNILNMNRVDIGFNEVVQTLRLYKRKYIDAQSHINYLWLVGCKQNKKKVNQRCIENSHRIGLIYHQTLNRTKFNNIIKFVFYVTLYRKSHDLSKQLLPYYDDNELLELVGSDQALEIFAHSRIDSLGIPSERESNILKKIDNVKVDLSKYQNNHTDFYFTPNKLGLRNIDSIHLLDENKYGDKIQIDLDNVKFAHIKIYKINLNKRYDIEHHEFRSSVKDGSLVIDNHINNSYCALIHVICYSTVDNQPLFKIKDIF